MDLKKLIDRLVESSEICNQTKFIPWWEKVYGDPGNFSYRYDIFEEDFVREAESCVAACSKEELLSPVGKKGLTLYHLLVWHNFYPIVEKLLCDGTIEPAEVDTLDGKGHGLTPFLLACAYGNLSMVRLLQNHGASDSVCDERGMNAYHFLAYPRMEDLQLDFTCLEKSVEQRGEIARLLTCDINKKNEKGFTPLEHMLSTEYCSNYTWPLAEVFLEKGATTDYVDPDGNTLLMLAYRNRHRTAALKLMEQHPEMINTANHEGDTLIRRTVDYQNHAMYLVLVDHGAEAIPNKSMEGRSLSEIIHSAFFDVNSDDRDNMAIGLYLTDKLIRQTDPDDDDDMGEVQYILRSALAYDKDCQVLRLCKEAGFDFTMPFHYHGETQCLRDLCLSYGQGTTVIQTLKELGVDLNRAVIGGETPVNILASSDKGESEDEDFYREVISFFSRESMEQTNKRGESAVHLAAKNGHTGMLQAMIEKGVDVNLTEDSPAEAGTTPLHLACSYGHTDAVRLLIRAGAEDSAKNAKGETAAHSVLINPRYGKKLEPEQKAEILRELKNLDVARDDGRTPLMLLRYDTRELLQLFIERGADVNHKDNNGVTAMMLYSDKDMIKELLLAGADLALADNEGNTVLHHALKDYNTGAARFLIKKGADYNRPNNYGETPAQIAVEMGADAVLELMTDIH